MLARPCKVPAEIEPMEHNPVIKCQHCGETRLYLDRACFLTPLSTAASPEKSAGALAVVASLVAAVKLARVESREIENRSPRVRSIISESITIARMVVAASKVKPSFGSRSKRKSIVNEPLLVLSDALKTFA